MPTPLTDSASTDNRLWNAIIAGVSLFIVTAVYVLIEGTLFSGLRGSADVSWMPHLNGLTNTGTTLCLLTALYFIRRRNIEAHRNAMLSAFGFTAIFLVSYITYHAFKLEPRSYGGPDFLRLPYLFVLLSHIALAPVVVPVALLALHRGLTDQRASHRRIVRFGYPMWLYVSISGVLVYVALYLL